ncbi:MAG: hypothetical protein RLZZ480_168 [Candidatus Parcubacteria bacterium]|jgi:hypothetical protein
MSVPVSKEDKPLENLLWAVNRVSFWCAAISFIVVTISPVMSFWTWLSFTSIVALVIFVFCLASHIISSRMLIKLWGAKVILF